MSKPLTIGLFSQAAGVNIETVRYYQRIGLMKEPEKPANGYRVYPVTDIGRIKFIKRAKKLGFNLTEIAELLELGSGHCDDVRKRAEHKRQVIDNQITDLIALRTTLDNLISACSSEDKVHCPIVETLTEPD